MGMACSLARRDLALAVPASESETGSMACSLVRRESGASRKESFLGRSIPEFKNKYMEDDFWEESLLWVKKLI